MEKRIIVDFDGVIHSYTSGWKGARSIPDPPVPGAIQWLCEMVSEFKVAILSSRSHVWGGRRAMKSWLREHAALHFNTVTGDEMMRLWGLIDYPNGMEPWEVELDQAAGHLVSRMEWPKHKLPASVQIDDRAITFTGVWPRRDSLDSFQPWNKEKTNGKA